MTALKNAPLYLNQGLILWLQKLFHINILDVVWAWGMDFEAIYTYLLHMSSSTCIIPLGVIAVTCHWGILDVAWNKMFLDLADWRQGDLISKGIIMVFATAFVFSSLIYIYIYIEIPEHYFLYNARN